MLTRLYIDNFRCFADFECHFDGNKQLIVGRNGSGKTSLFELLLFLRQFAISGELIDNVQSDRTNWLSKELQTFEIEALLGNDSYLYRLVIEIKSETRYLVKAETVYCSQKPLLEFLAGQAHLYNDQSELKNNYPLDPHRSALATVAENSRYTKLGRFKDWFSQLAGFKINPFLNFGSLVSSEQAFPKRDLSNFVDWYWHLTRIYSAEQHVLFENLSATMDGFESLNFLSLGTFHILFAQFAGPNKRSVKFLFDQLSDGQRCLIYLYSILRFVVAEGGTLVLDEPENFLSLRELQPWLMALTDVLDAGQGQAILISHHPEFINQWAPNHGIQLVRDGTGPVRAQKFAEGLEYALPAAELVARGWELE